VLFKFVDGLDEFISDVSVTGSGSHSLNGKVSSSVVVTLGVPFSRFGTDSSSRVVFIIIGRKLVEFLEGVVVEKVSESGESGSRVLNFGQVNVTTLSLVDYSEDVFSEESNDFKSFVMFLKGFNEHEVGVTSVFSVGFNLLEDFVSSVVDPGQVFGGNLDFVFDVFSVSSCLVTNSLILVSNVSEVSNLLSELLFLSSIGFVGLSLGFDICIFKISEQVKSRFNSVSCLCLHVQKGSKLSLELSLFGNDTAGQA